MAAFYGTVDGMSKTQGTRRGSAASGIKVSAQSWNGSVVTELNYNSNDELVVTIGLSSGSASSMCECDIKKEIKYEDFVNLIKNA